MEQDQVRLRFGAAMALKGGRSAIIGVEVRERRNEAGILEHDYLVGSIDRLSPYDVGTCADRLLELTRMMQEFEPCSMVDVGSPQGLALHQATRDLDWPKGLHKPHAYLGTGQRNLLFATFLKAYTAGRLHFRKGLKFQRDLETSLVFYQGQGIKKSGFELESEDEAMVIALGLAMLWPKHGPDANAFAVGLQ